ncbi:MULTISPECIES: hypothetical protein [Meiothermus]|uniref:Uncharacterized protein n=2 Tax=Meiothermus hypogaeus TaxID=884155 RepID=A0A511QXJ3_9DEIN|nr:MULTISPECIES: hypothetical protein [Meiothermus]RIH80834.1 hypothetical protein Mhypo_00125 [Meiothermus hypogaeus]GEM82099.1 hypothetical protein MHY01S_02650 [Meiothermus hypogaeus NBRC 106114]GIW32959.1 MAG: hypothetical protein KatS3mg072_0292 [Meiothermus sp.]GIW37160.1 MAG: hypothetical protein KatS3mg073_1305 [Meiothermus sp.]
MADKAKEKQSKEPFPGAYFVGLVITLVLLIVVVAVGAGLPPAISGFSVALLLGLTVNPKYALGFLSAGVLATLLGFAGSEPQVAWGGLGLILSSLVVWRFVKA